MQTDRSDVSPRSLARIGGLLYLIIIVIGVFGEMGVRNRIVSGDGAATVANLREMESLWRFGVAAECALLICGIALACIFYVLLKPAGRTIAMMATSFNLVSLAVEAVGALSLAQTLFPLGSADYVRALPPEHINAMANLYIKAHTYAFGVALIFFGCFCVLAGYLIVRSGYIPKLIGVLMQIAGACYLVNSFALLAAPALASKLFPAILLPCFVGEAAFCVWLLVKGVNEEKWTVRAAQA